MRDLVEAAINLHLDQEQLRVLKVAEASEREQLKLWARKKRRRRWSKREAAIGLVTN